MDHWNQWLEHAMGPLGWTGQAAIRLCIAAIMGAVVGLEREIRGREAGFRTNLLVCLGSALVMLASIRLASIPFATSGHGYIVSLDPGRIAYGVMAGIGFLGAGAIMKHQHTVRGLTTAAALWCVAAMGLTIGQGQYVLAIFATGLVLVALWLLDYVEDMLPARRHRRLTIRCPWDAHCVRELVARIEKTGVTVTEYGFQRLGDLSQAEVMMTITFTDLRKYDAVENELLRDPRCLLVSSERI